MSFLFLSNIDIKFTKVKKLTWRSYDTAKTLSTTSKVEIIDKKEFIKTALDENSKTFVVHVATLKVPIAILRHPSRTS